jgi:hypothetical protein
MAAEDGGQRRGRVRFPELWAVAYLTRTSEKLWVAWSSDTAGACSAVSSYSTHNIAGALPRAAATSRPPL